MKNSVFVLTYESYSYYDGAISNLVYTVVGVYASESAAQKKGEQIIPECKGVDYVTYHLEERGKHKVLRIIEKPIKY